MKILFLTPAPDYPEDWDWAFTPQAAPLIARGATVDHRRWNDAGDLSSYDLILPLICWGYHLRFAEWTAFLDRLEREPLPVVNPPRLLRWNSDKAYLAELPGKGVSTVPSILADRCTDEDLREARAAFGRGEIVVKPPISAGADGTYRLAADEGLPHELRDKRVIIQPMIDSVTTKGEYSLLLFDGKLSHAVIKRPKSGDFRVQPHLGGITESCKPPPGGEALAHAALAAAPAHATYARIDMVEGEDGELMIMEMELVEPALFLKEAPHGSDAYAAAILSAAERACEQPLA
jgi:glutathione synthase/RimK-type ligase-like ATP-grasp enzyme